LSPAAGKVLFVGRFGSANGRVWGISARDRTRERRWHFSIAAAVVLAPVIILSLNKKISELE
jgi:hypothetical protein